VLVSVWVSVPGLFVPASVVVDELELEDVVVDEVPVDAVVDDVAEVEVAEIEAVADAEVVDVSDDERADEEVSAGADEIAAWLDAAATDVPVDDCAGAVSVIPTTLSILHEISIGGERQNTTHLSRLESTGII
jgi:hypothetical protein